MLEGTALSSAKDHATQRHKPRYPFTPSQHAEALHPVKAKGQVFIARKLPPAGKWTTDPDPYHPWELDMVLYGIAGDRDIYATMNRFEGRRKVLQQHVCELSAIFADLDFYDLPELAGRTPEAVFELVLERLRSAGMPEPSLAICSGQGLYVGWLHSPVGWKELPKWQDCQYRIWRIFKSLGADPRARDAARLLRLVGTTNSKNSGPVYALRDAGPRQSFEDLAASILRADLGEDEEQPGADLYDLRAQRATRRESLWLARWVDLQTLRRLRYGDEQMKDFRDRLLFVAGVALSWITDPPEPKFFERELLGLAEEWGGWDEGRSRSKLQAVLERVRMVAGGQTVMWQGIEIDPRYRFRSNTIVEWLEITAAEQHQMFNLIGANEKRRRNTESKREKRRAAGSQPRPQYDEARKLSRQNDCATAHHLRKKFNLSTTEIGQIMGKSARTVRRLLE
jgi:hypothetical protein